MTPSEERRPVVFVLLCLYPAYWIATVLVNALPALALVLVSGGEIAELRAGWTGIAVVASPPSRIWVVVTLTICAVAFLWLGRRRNSVLWGVMLTMLGVVAIGPLLTRPQVLPGMPWPWHARFGIGAVCLFAGLRWIVYAIVGRTRPARLHWQSAAVLVLMAALSFGAGWSADLALRRNKAEALRAALDGVPPVPANAPFEKNFFQRGVNFTAEFPGGYSSANALRILKELVAYGVNSIAVVPYGFTSRDNPSVRFPGGWESDESIALVSRVAHHLGIKVLLKPQVWVRPGYPGDLDFATEDMRRQWFADYGRFVEHYAKLATVTHADVFCVGVEFARLSVHEQSWRELIALARRHYTGPLVYAANFGPEFETIRFWDALDYAGLNNYYPLPDDLSTEEIASKVERVAIKIGKPVIFTEAGFSSYENPHRQPWDETPSRLDLEAQARAYEAVFRAFYHRPWFAGVYWWKIGTNGAGGIANGAHTPWRKPAMEVLGRWYRGSER